MSKGGKGGKGKAISGKNKKTPQSRSARAGLQVSFKNCYIL
jgi:hypothetical protein